MEQRPNTSSLLKSLRGLFLLIIAVAIVTVLYLNGDTSPTIAFNRADLLMIDHYVDHEEMNNDTRTALKSLVHQANEHFGLSQEDNQNTDYLGYYMDAFEGDLEAQPTNRSKLTPDDDTVETEINSDSGGQSTNNEVMNSPVTNLNDQVISINCTHKVDHFMLSKIEKTGTSTLYTVFARFVRFHKLNLAIQTVGWHLALQNGRNQRPGWYIGPRPQEKADALIDHAIWNEGRIKEIMYEDTQFIVSVREPISHFKSVVNFFQKESQKYSPEQIVMNHSEVFDVERHRNYETIKNIFHNMQLGWLGLTWADRYDMTKVQQVVDASIQRYQIIMITDLFDASLVLMKRKFCWDHTDILYISANTQNSAKAKSQGLSDAAKKRLLSKDMNFGDKMLYDNLKERWLSDPIVHTKDFWEEVKYFTGLNKEKQALCRKVIMSRLPYTIPASRWSQPLTLNYGLCREFTMSIGKIHQDMHRYAKTGAMPL